MTRAGPDGRQRTKRWEARPTDVFRLGDSPSPSCIVIDVEGNITPLDYTLAQRTVQRVARGRRPVSLVVRLGEIRQVTASFEMSDIGLIRDASKYLRRAALVTDDAATRDRFLQYAPQARTYAPAFSAEMRTFTSVASDEAVVWACEGVPERE